MAETSIQRLIDEGGYDFIDYGCSHGNSIKYGMSRLGGKRGIGIDLDPKKIADTEKAGYTAVLADATQIGCRTGSVRFGLMLHFLEHLPSRRVADQTLRAATMYAREFVYVRQPWFEGSAALLPLGYRLYWADWTGHPNHYSAVDFVNVLSRSRRVKRFLVFGRTPVLTTRDNCLVSLSAPPNSQAASAEDVATREEVALPERLFRELVCMIQLGTPQQFEPPLALVDGQHHLIYDSAAAPGTIAFARMPLWRRWLRRLPAVMRFR
jgi:hypothetical protein